MAKEEHKPIQKNVVMEPPNFNWLKPCLKPKLVLFGWLLGFAVSSILGHFVAERNIYKDFFRFHCYICPTSQYFPTFCQLLNLAKTGLRSDQTLVIVGGDSILNGAGQQLEHLWTRRLQRLLGDSYRVRNFAFPGAYSFDAGYLVAEAMKRIHRRVIYVTDSNPATDGMDGFVTTYGYLYDDAKCKGFLLDDAARNNAISNLRSRSAYPQIEMLDERYLRSILDSGFFFEDLWTTVSYKYFCTVWNARTLATPWKARRFYQDNLVPQMDPSTARFQNCKNDLEFIRSKFGEYFQLNKNTISRNDAAFERLQERLTESTPTTLRTNMLLILTNSCPNHLDRLSALERICNERLYIDCAEVWRKSGFRTITYDKSFNDDDFFDGRHLSNEGGEKLADIVAKEVREIEAELIRDDRKN